MCIRDSLFTLAPSGVVIEGLGDAAEIGAGLVVFGVGGPAAIEVDYAQERSGNLCLTPCQGRYGAGGLLTTPSPHPERVLSVMCGRPRRSKSDLVCCAAVGCGHVSGLRCAAL